MLIDIYNQLLIMSVVGGGLYLILKLLSVITLRYFTAAWHYFSYLFLSTFFLIPYFTLLSRLDLHSIPKVDELVLLSQAVLNPSSRIHSDTEQIVAISGESYTVYSYLELLPYLLMAGTVILTVIIIVQNYRLNQRIFRACRLVDDKEILETFTKCKQELGIVKKIPVYISAYISTPFLSGIFKPRIVLPNIELQTEELRYVFIHELTHWKNHDAWLKFLMLLINVVHWFNPLAYMARRDIDRFCEAFCDVNVTRSMNQEERSRYCELILSVLWRISDQNILYSAFSDKRNIERRICMIMKNEKSKKWVRMLAVTVTLALAVTGTAAAYAATAGGTVNSPVPAERGKDHNLVFAQPVPVGKNIPKEGPSTLDVGGEITPYDVQLINNAHYVGTSAYEKQFTLSPENGTELNVWVKNNHSSKSVKFKVIHVTSGTDFGYKYVGPGGQLTRNFYMPDGGGLSGTWKVYVTSDDGHKMDINVSARQF